jgi:upstream activation factor subunit UAF30
MDSTNIPADSNKTTKMARTTSAPKTKKEAPVKKEVVAAPVAEAEAKPRAQKRKRVEPAAEPVVVETVVVAPAGEKKARAQAPKTFGEAVTSLRTRIGDKTAFSSKSLLKSLASLQKHHDKEVASAVAAGKKKQRKPRDPSAPARKPSGITKPVVVSPELMTFMKAAAGTLVSRTQATKSIIEYVQERKLQDPKNKRIINADAVLQKLLRLKPEDELTIPSLQKVLSVHFPAPAPKKASPVVTVPAPTTARK